MPMRAENPEALEWPSEFRAAFDAYDKVYADLLALDVEGANRWRVAMLKAEWLLSDGEDGFEKWEERADRIEARLRSGAY
jgi:hypothetical protein